MTTEEIVKKLKPWLARQRRPGWKPVVVDGDGPATASKFSGTPWIGPDAPWPECGHCKNPLQHFLQLDLGDLPEQLGQCFGIGLLQLFYCTREECQGYGGWEPFADDLSRVRIVRPAGPGTRASVPTDSFPAKLIVGWTRFIDLPKPSEHEELGLKYNYDHKAGTVRLECPQLGLVFDNIKDRMLAENIANSELGDKLGGWPAWIQNVEYPNCPRCGRRMVHVFQVDSEHNVPFMFGMRDVVTLLNARTTKMLSPSAGPAADQGDRRRKAVGMTEQEWLKCDDVPKLLEYLVGRTNNLNGDNFYLNSPAVAELARQRSLGTDHST